MTAIDSDDDCILSQALDMAKYNKNCEIYSGDDASLSQALDLAIEPSFQPNFYIEMEDLLKLYDTWTSAGKLPNDFFMNMIDQVIKCMFTNGHV